MNSCHF